MIPENKVAIVTGGTTAAAILNATVSNDRPQSVLVNPWASGNPPCLYEWCGQTEEDASHAEGISHDAPTGGKCNGDANFQRTFENEGGMWSSCGGQAFIVDRLDFMIGLV